MNQKISLLLLSLLISLPVCAQKSKIIQSASKALTQAPQVTGSLSATLKRTALQAVKRPDIRLSVARLDHACILSTPTNKRPHSSAFLFETTYKGKKEIWAATSSHVTQKGEPLLLTFFNGKKSFPVFGDVVRTGPALLSDIALIKLQEPLPPQLKPFKLANVEDTQSPLSLWGYSYNKLYHVENLTFEKDNTRFLRTDFPFEQRRRAGLCGGPLLNQKEEVLGVACGVSMEDKAYATSIRIIPYLLQAYHEGSAEIPLMIHGKNLGNIHIDERIYLIRCLDENGTSINLYETYDQLHQSDIERLLNDPEVHYLQLILGSYGADSNPVYRALTYDKKTGTHWIEPYKQRTSRYE